MAKEAVLEGQKLHVTNESYPNDGEVTDHPVEGAKGSITDHVSTNRKSVAIEGALVRPTKNQVESLVKRLQDWQKKGELLQYEGRQIMQNVVIEGFTVEADSEIANGYNFSMTLVQIEIAESSYQEITKPVTNEGRKQPKNQNTGAKYHRVKRGDTYWGCSRKYGVTVNQLRNWNPWPDREIPIGVNMRVG